MADYIVRVLELQLLEAFKIFFPNKLTIQTTRVRSFKLWLTFSRPYFPLSSNVKQRLNSKKIQHYDVAKFTIKHNIFKELLIF